MPKIIDISWKLQEIDCIACAIQNWTVNLPVERIAETKNFVLEQDFERPIEWFLIIASKKHNYSILDFTFEEYNEYCELLFKARKILKKITSIKHVTFVQEEFCETSHFHTWLFPWHNWMGENVWNKIYNIKDIMNFAKQNYSTKQNLEKIKNTSKLLKQEYEFLSK